MRSWWDSADMSKPDEKNDPGEPPKTERKRKHSAWNVYRGEAGGHGSIIESRIR